MGQSIDLHIYELDKLKAALNKRGAQGELLDKILAKCGSVFGNNYVLLNNEVWDGGSPYYNLSSLIDSAFGIEDSFDDLLHGKYQTEGINYVELEEVADELGITLPED